jgi:hypothetical protein
LHRHRQKRFYESNAFINAPYEPVQGIVKSQKKGAESGINRTVMTSHTIAGVLGHFKGHWLLKIKKQVSALMLKKGGVCFEGAYATKKFVHGCSDKHPTSQLLRRQGA